MARFTSARNEAPSFLQQVAGVLGLGGNSDSPKTKDDLDAWLKTTIEEAFGITDIQRDEDGDVPIRYGSAVVFIRRSDPESPFLEIFAPLLEGFTITPDVYEAVNALNRQVPMAKATVDADNKEIILSADVLIAHTLSPDNLMFAVELVADTADHFDTLLQKRFGGRTMLDDDDDSFDV
ncbi:YbjN domain-containing protein [Mycolicibacter sinensis]